MNRMTRKITDGAMMLAIIGVLLFINRQMAGLLEGTILFLFPIPMVLYSAKYGWKDSIATYVAMILLTIMIGTPQTLFYVSAEALIGMIYGSGIYRKTNLKKLMLKTMILAVIVDMISMIILASFFGFDLVYEIKTMTETIESTVSKAGTALPATIQLDQMVKSIMIVATIFAGILEGFITHVVSITLLKRLHYQIPDSTSLYEYMPPKWTSYLALATIILFYATMLQKIENESLMMIFQTLGLAGLCYLILFGYMGVVVLMKFVYPNANKLWLLVFFFILITMPIIVALFGFLYIATDIYQKASRGDLKYEKKN